MSSVAQLQLDPDGEKSAAPDAWRSMAAFLVSGMLMSFLGAILPGLGLSSAIGVHRGRRLFPELGVGPAFVGGRRSFSASTPGAEVRFGSGEPAGVRRIPVPGAFFAAGAATWRLWRRAVHRIQRGIAERGGISCHLSDLSASIAPQP